VSLARPALNRLMQGYLAIRNFRQFDCNRDGVRLPYQLLEDRRFRALPDTRKAHLLCLLLLAGRMHNALPAGALQLERMIGATESVELDALGEFLLIHPAQCCSIPRSAEIRPVPEALRAAVMVRDGARCRRCGSTRQLEIDHIIPVSRGGSSEEHNLQTLCRRCNRRKWKKLIPRI
jgi:HNH endonuclease